VHQIEGGICLIDLILICPGLCHQVSAKFLYNNLAYRYTAFSTSPGLSEPAQKANVPLIIGTSIAGCIAIAIALYLIYRWYIRKQQNRVWKHSVNGITSFQNLPEDSDMENGRVQQRCEN